MPSKSFSQARMMAGAAHDPVFAKKVGVPTKVAKEFNKADDKSGFLSSAMRAKGPAYKEGGKVKKFESGGDVDYYEKPAHLYQDPPRRGSFSSGNTMKSAGETLKAGAQKFAKNQTQKAARTEKFINEPREDPQSAAFYRKGGSVKGKGAEQRGTRPAKYY